MSLYLILEDEAREIASLMLEARSVASIDKINASLQQAVPVSISGKKATILIRGVLEPERVAMYDWFDKKQTSYSDLHGQISQAKSAGVKEIDFKINSVGGNIVGMLPMMKMIKGLSEDGIKTKAIVSNVAASAAYMLASQCDTIDATSELDRIGSNGVQTTRIVSPNIKNITNTASPLKNPDASTEEGEKAIQSELDDVFNVLTPHVAAARNTTVEDVEKNFGRGAVMTAKTALSKGMIDAIVEPNFSDKKNVIKAGDPAQNRSNLKMDKAILKAEHPDLYAQVYEEGVKAGQEEGVKSGQEEYRKAVEAHLVLSDASGDTARAMEDIKAMNPVDALVQAHHTAAGIKRTMINSRGEESPETVSGEGGEELDEEGRIKKNLEASVEGLKVVF